MATAAQVIKAALQRILVQGSEADLEPDEYQDAIFDLNNMMLAYDAQGIRLGYTSVSDLGDTITIPPGAIMGTIDNLAIKVAPDYGRTASPELIRDAETGLNIMRLLGVNLPETEMPYTLPVGSGNEGSWVRVRDYHFYDDNESVILNDTVPAFGILSLENNSTATTISIAGTGVLVAGSWKAEGAFKFDATAAGRFTYQPASDLSVTLTAEMDIESAAASDQIVSAWFYENGYAIAGSKRSVTIENGGIGKLRMEWAMTLSEDDYIELYIANESGTDNLTVTDCRFRVNQ